ncbi:MAG: hypothetical protein KDD45_15200 [Bdellovibrionales bacterium]|nr:hypothetical protein [Bdellovibrionales bacterium]
MDWRTTNDVSAVQDQGGSCLSCWAFSAVGALESSYLVQRD